MCVCISVCTIVYMFVRGEVCLCVIVAFAIFSEAVVASQTTKGKICRRGTT